MKTQTVSRNLAGKNITEYFISAGQVGNLGKELESKLNSIANVGGRVLNIAKDDHGCYNMGSSSIDALTMKLNAIAAQGKMNEIRAMDSNQVMSMINEANALLN